MDSLPFYNGGSSVNDHRFIKTTVYNSIMANVRAAVKEFRVNQIRSLNVCFHLVQNMFTCCYLKVKIKIILRFVCIGVSIGL